MEVTTEDKEFTITNKDGSTVTLMGKVTTTKDGFDEDGNPKVSVQINVPPIDLGATPGEIQ